MIVTVKITKSFNSAAKPLLKKYHSLSKDLLNLEKDLIVTPRLGTSLGQDVYKIRFKILSKGKGKSGGARVISLVETILVSVTETISSEEIVVNLITIYDKADVDNISDKELKELIKNVKAK
ncbi:MAG TPA: addiction module toxin RelE [Chitinophagaceae bacterium]|nr:addiction module toxin RelE [Chitinophagaceae bacterium]